MTKGPLIEINELRKILMNNMKTKDISLMDIEKAIESVSELKCGFQIVTVKNSKAVVTVPMEKDAAVDDIIKMASENDGWIGYSICYNKKGMKQIEFENAIKTLLNHGVAWEDRQNFIKNQTKWYIENFEGIEDIKIDELADVECTDNSFLELTGKGFITLVDNSLNKITIIDLIQDN